MCCCDSAEHQVVVPWANCGIGVDHTVYSLIAGRVRFTDAHDKYKPGKKVINVVPHEDWPATLARAARSPRSASKNATATA